jgi:hypothetical protein
MEKLREITPLDFVNDDERISEKITNARRRHIVLFYEEPEYAAQICLEYVQAGLDTRRSCAYVSKEPIDYVKNEMIAVGISDYEVLGSEGLLKVKQFPDLYGYPGGSKKGLEEIAAILADQKLERLTNSRIKKKSFVNLQDKHTNRALILDRTVLKSIHSVKLPDEVKANMTLEKRHHRNYLVFEQSSLLVTYPVSNILSTARGRRGIYSDWMDLLVRKYDTVIFAFSVKDGGIALNLV